jgi:poly(A) polymerase
MTQPPDENLGKHADREDAVAVVKRLRDAGHVAYFAGGCVRDTLLGLTPKDFDVATDAPPDRVRQLFSNTQAVGAAFGVILVRHRKSVIEVATFRTDLQYKDGRRPEGVVFTTAEEDAKRRDFTINGLFMDPLEGDNVIDFVGGQDDLKSRVLRAIGEPNHRFEEDHLRLLRAVRFAARFDLVIEPTTDAAMARHAPFLSRISPERVAEELRLTLTPPTRRRAWNMIDRFGFDDIIFRFYPRTEPAHPGVRASRGAIVLQRLAPDRTISFGFALAAISVEYAIARLAHLAEWRQMMVRALVKALRQALRISNDESDEMEGTLYGLELLLTATNPSVAALKRFLARPTAPLSRQLSAALPKEVINDTEAGELERRLSELEKTNYAPPPLITGDDLTAAGLQPGPLFKRILDAVYDEQLEGHISNKEQALELARRLAKDNNGFAN